MNTITRSGVAARQRSSAISVYPLPVIRLPVYLHVALLMLTPLVVVLTGWVVLIRRESPPANPFSAYAEIFPRRPSNSLIKQEFSCVSTRPDTNPIDTQYCTHESESGLFWLITSTIKEGVIRRTDFKVREGALTLGDVMFLWGRPQVRRYQQSVLLEWPNLGISGTGWAENRQFSYYMPVTRISIGPASIVKTG